MRSPKLRIGAVLFEGFELLDIFGPLELLGMLSEQVDIVMLSLTAGKIRSAQGPYGYADQPLQTCPAIDLLLIPGGPGTRTYVHDTQLLEELKRLSEIAHHVATICTGAALLAKTQVLNGKKATTNKQAFAWVAAQAPLVHWVPQARWVEEGKFFTSSGVSAGMDMALALIATLFGRDKSLAIAQSAEYEWHDDPSWDPFAQHLP